MFDLFKNRYVFRSLEDQAPTEVVALDYCTIDLVAESSEVPRFAFQVVSLKEGETFVFAASSSKVLCCFVWDIFLCVVHLLLLGAC